MNWNRRRFLTHGGLTLGLGGAFAATDAPLPSMAALADQPLTYYERVFAETTHLEALGVPRSWESVGRGFHPFSPDRVAILPADKRLSAAAVANCAQRIREVLHDSRLDLAESFWSSEIFRLYVEVSRALSAYYPDMPSESWLSALVRGEQFYGGWPHGQVHWLISLQFPPAQTPRVVNPPVDWWLFLLHEPPEVETFVGVQRPCLAVGHVYAGGRESSRFDCDVGFLGQEWLRSLSEDPQFVADVARMDRVSAARWMNLQMAFVLERLNE